MKVKHKKTLLSLLGVRFDRGMGKYSETIIQALSDSMKDQLIICIDKRDRIPKHLHNILLKNNTRIYAVNIALPIAEQFVIPLLVKLFKVDIAIFPANTFPLWKPAGVKYISVIHDTMFMSKESSPLIRQKVGKLYRKFIIASGINGIDLVISPSHSVEKILKSIYPKIRVEIIPNSFNFSSLMPNRDEEILNKLNLTKEGYIYTITGTTYNKNLGFLLKAYNKLNAVYPEVKLVISGVPKKEVFKAYGDLIQSLKISDKIIFTGYIEDSDICTLMKNSMAFVMLSKDEGFGRPVIEALWCGAVVLVSDIPVFREIGKDYVEYLDISNEFCLAEFFKERYHIAKKRKLEKSGEISEYLISNFDAKRLGERFLELLGRLVS